ncbi:MAG: hypothetical protein Q4D76_12865 [Oscillospiraceae bacterium]|nr:hypothetical protein [Oscillospiraceae bacterium]
MNNFINDWIDELPDDIKSGFLKYFENEKNKNRMVDVNKLKSFIDSANKIKSYFSENSVDGFKFDIKLNPKCSDIGRVIVSFNAAHLDTMVDIKDLSDNFSYIEVALMNDNKVQLEFGMRNLLKEV